MSPRKPPYPPEFRAAVVRQVLEEGKSRRRTAADAGVSSGTLGKWVRQAEIDAGLREGLTSEERRELIRLRKEHWILKEEVEILRKARTYFAEEARRKR